MSDRRPPLQPPPPDAVRLYVSWQAVREHRIELEQTLPHAGETVAGGIVMPVQDPQVLEARAAESAAALAFYRHPWWFGAFSKSEAEQVITKAAQAAAGED